MALLALAAGLGLLLLDSAIELALISSMVGYLHRSGANLYSFGVEGGDTFQVPAKPGPGRLLLNQGHTSNGAAGTGIVFSIVGFFIVWRQRRKNRQHTVDRPSRIFTAFTVLIILAWLLSLVALAYTFSLTNSHKDQTISVSATTWSYPADDTWTPENWDKAILALPLTSDTDRSYLSGWVKVMEGWRFNLIPLFLIYLLVASLCLLEVLRERGLWMRSNRESGTFSRSKEGYRSPNVPSRDTGHLWDA